MTHLLFTCICSSKYHGRHTIDDLLEELAAQAQELYYEGVVDTSRKRNSPLANGQGSE